MGPRRKNTANAFLFLKFFIFSFIYINTTRQKYIHTIQMTFRSISKFRWQKGQALEIDNKLMYFFECVFQTSALKSAIARTAALVISFWNSKSRRKQIYREKNLLTSHKNLLTAFCNVTKKKRYFFTCSTGQCKMSQHCLIKYCPRIQLASHVGIRIKMT